MSREGAERVMHALLAQPKLGWDPSWWPTYNSENLLHLAGYLLMVIGAVALLWAVAVVARRLAKRVRPMRVFVAISRAMGLSYSDCWCLWRLARAQQLTNPLTLLISSATLQFHAEEHADRHRWSRRRRRRFEILRRRLFERSDPSG